MLRIQINQPIVNTIVGDMFSILMMLSYSSNSARSCKSIKEKSRTVGEICILVEIKTLEIFTYRGATDVTVSNCI